MINTDNWKLLTQITIGTVSGMLLSTLAQAERGGSGGGHHHFGEGGWSMMFMGPFMMILTVVLIVVAVVLVMRWLAPSSLKTGASGSSALDILNERFARGEIDADEYRSRKNELT